MADFRTILICLGHPGTVASTLTMGIDVARQFGAHLDAVHVKSDPAMSIPLVGEGMSSRMVEEMLKAAQDQQDQQTTEIKSIFDRMAAESGLPVVAAPTAKGASLTWREETGREEEVFSSLGRLTDLIVVPRPQSVTDAAGLLSLNATLLESGRPVLMAPPDASSGIGHKIAILWNGSVEATRAVGFAMPFLEQAKEVTIFSACEPGTADPAELTRYLAWRGIDARPRSFGIGAQVAQMLLNEAGAIDADLLVMGAYTHSRLRQLIMGGVTRHVLQCAPIPVLFGH